MSVMTSVDSSRPSSIVAPNALTSFIVAPNVHHQVDDDLYRGVEGIADEAQ